jgi:hypothetical protein
MILQEVSCEKFRSSLCLMTIPEMAFRYAQFQLANRLKATSLQRNPALKSQSYASSGWGVRRRAHYSFAER